MAVLPCGCRLNTGHHNTALYCSLGSLAMKLLMMAVLAVPGPPTSSVACTAVCKSQYLLKQGGEVG